MGFAQEIRDFTAAYSTVSEIGEKKKNRDLAEKKLNHDIEYENALLAIKRQEADAKTAKLAAGSGGTGGDGGMGGKASTDGAASVDTKNGKKFVADIYDDYVTTDENRTDGANDENADAVAASGKDPAMPDTTGFTDDMAEDALNMEKGGLVEEPEAAAGPFKVPAKAALPTEEAPAAPASSPRPKVNPKAALPTEAAAEPPAEAPSPAEAPAPEAKPAAAGASTIVVRKAMEATGAALDGFEKKYSTAPQAIGGEEFDDRSDLATGQGGMTFDEYEAIAQTVDPNGEIPKRLQSAANISATYDYFVKKGEPQKAVEVAKAYLVTELRVNQTLGVLATTAFEEGNIIEGCKLVNDACSRFPSGHQITVAPAGNGRYMYEVTDPEGNVIEKEQIGTDELMESVQGIADGSLYKKMLAQMVVASRPQKGENKEYNALDGVQSAYTNLTTAIATYEALPEDATIAEKREAYAAASAAADALEAAKQSAADAGLSFKDVQSAAQPPAEGAVALPEKPMPRPGGLFSAAEEDPDTAPAAATAAPTTALPTEDPAKSALPPAPASVLQAAKAAIAKGAKADAVAARLKEQGYSAEGL